MHSHTMTDKEAKSWLTSPDFRIRLKARLIEEAKAKGLTEIQILGPAGYQFHKSAVPALQAAA